MDFLVYLVYPLLAFLLLWKSKFYKKNSWNEEFLSLTQTKAIQGMAAICIIFHHLSQKTSAPWLAPEYQVTGLEFFVPIGYLFVALFFFFSGYGLLKSFKTKENYLSGFLDKHIGPLLIALITSGLCFLAGRSWMQCDYTLGSLISIGEPHQINPYGWYALTLMLFYLIFYLAFKYTKTIKQGVIITSAGVLLYILYCDFSLFGTWWYNSVPAFVVGLIFAMNEDKIVPKIKKHYIVYLIISLILTTIFIITSSIDKNSVHRLVILFSQMGCSITFVFSVLLFGMKVKIGNKALNFVGKFTLELYLLHGLFVQIFSYCFISEKSTSPYYIQSLPLYILVVLVISIPLSYCLHLLHKVIIKFFKKYNTLYKVMKKDALKVCIGLCCFFIVLTIFTSITSHKESKEIAADFEQYQKDNITFVNVNGKKMATFVQGKGPHTIVLFGPQMSTLGLRPIAETLSENNKVIILDLFGTGFSDTVSEKRTNQNIVKEIHEALHQLGEDGPVILFSHTLSGIYMLEYTNTYPEQVEAVIGMETYVYDEFADSLRANNLNRDEYIRSAKRSAQLQSTLQTVGKATGYIDWFWAINSSAFQDDFTDNDRLLLGELFKRKYFSKNAKDELINEYDNYLAVKDMKYPDELPVFFILGYDTCYYHYFYGDWELYHKNQLTSSPLCKISVITGDSFGIYWNHRLVGSQIDDFVKLIDSSKVSLQ